MPDYINLNTLKTILEIIFYIFVIIGLYITFSKYTHDYVAKSIYNPRKASSSDMIAFLVILLITIGSIYISGVIMFNYPMIFILVTTLITFIWTISLNKFEDCLITKNFKKAYNITRLWNLILIFSYITIVFFNIGALNYLLTEKDNFTTNRIFALLLNYFLIMVFCTFIIQGHTAYKSIGNSNRVKYKLLQPNSTDYGYVIDDDSNGMLLLTKDFKLERIFYSNITTFEYENQSLFSFIKDNC